MEDFEAWVRARAAALARSAYLLTGDAHLAEDLVQDTLARVADRWPRPPPPTRCRGRHAPRSL